MSYERAPFLVIWETTRACDLACTHCRAEAQPLALPGELSHEEGLSLVEAVARMGTRILIFSGGDPLKRSDLPDLIRRAKSLGLRAATIPAATGLVSPARLKALKTAGLDQVAFSLDAGTEALHDRIRGVPGAFRKTLQAVGWAKAAGLPVQINSVISGHHAGGEFERLIRLVKRLDPVFWEVFFLVPVGRAQCLPGLSAEEIETTFAGLYRLWREGRFIVKITEAPHFKRYALQQRLREAGIDPAHLPPAEKLYPPSRTGPRGGPAGSIGLSSRAVNAGKGFLFVSYSGEVFPSGFLPLSAGNIRKEPLERIYRDAPLFQALRDPGRLKGRCGRCEFRQLCGGSRSRAYALTGDPLAEDPACVYQPARAVRESVG